MKYKFLFISIGGDAMPFCQRLENAGYTCYFYIHKPKAKTVGDGILKNKINDYHEVLQKEKQKDLIIIFDQNGLGYTADYLRRLGYMVVNGGSFADRLEFDREFGFEILKKAVNIPETYKFTDWQTARDFISEQDKDARFVFKPSGSTGSDKTYVSKDNDDLLNQLTYYEEIWKEDEGTEVNFELQQFIEGTEISYAGYFNGDNFIDNSFTVTFEEKKFMNDNVGAAVGCAGEIVWFLATQTKYIQEYLLKLTPILKENSFVGQIDINNIIDNNGKPYGLEFTPRWGYDSSYCECQLLGIDKFAEMLINIATRKDFKEDFFPVNKPSMSIRLSVPPYPIGDACMTGGQTISFPKNMDNIYLEDVICEDDEYKTGGIDGVTCNVVVTGDTIEQCQKEVYEIIKQIKIPDVQYRTDIGIRVAEDMKVI